MIIRTKSRSALLLVIGLLSGALPARAAVPSPAELDRQYPKGSITTAAQAQRALVDTLAAGGALDRAFEAERVRCARMFLATQCLDNARRAHARGSAQIRRIEVEAHDLQRRQAADDRKAQREARATQAATHSERTSSAHAPATPKGAGDRAAGDAPADAARQQAQELASRERYTQRQNQHERDESHRVEIQIRDSADNARRFQEKQAHARAYAVEKAKEREDNEKSRAEREQERKKKFAPDDIGGTASEH